MITAAGIAIVAIGGGGIQPMRARWERALSKVDDESGRMRNEAQGARERIKARADQVTGQAKATMQESQTTTASSATQMESLARLAA